MRTALKPDLVSYVVLAFSGMWLAMLPLLLTGYRRETNEPGMGTLQLVCVYAAMLTPLLAALVVKRGPKALGLVWPTPWRKGLLDCLLAILVPVGLTLASLVVAALAGSYKFDLTNLSGFRAEFAPDAGGTGVPWSAVIAWSLALILQMVISLPFFLGEEGGWQGYLLPRLWQYGRVAAYTGTAVIFGLWHLPTLLMGGQYPGYSLFASVGAFLVSCLLVVPIFSWLRMRSNSVLPAVIAHTVVSSATMRIVWLFSSSDVELDPMQVGLQAWPGWVVMAAFVGWLVWRRRL